MKNTRLLLERRKKRNRNFLKKKLNGKLRLTVFRSNNHIYCQIIDDDKAKTLLSSSTLEADIKNKIKSTGSMDAALEVGRDIAKKAVKKSQRDSNKIKDRFPTYLIYLYMDILEHTQIYIYTDKEHAYIEY